MMRVISGFVFGIVVALTVGVSPMSHGQVVEYSLGNARFYDQLVDDTQPAGVPLYASGVYVVTEPGADLTGMSISGYANGAAMMIPSEDEWLFEQTWSSLSNMLTNAGAGTYTFTAVGGDLDGVTQTLDLVGDHTSFPNVPYLTGSSFSDLQGINYTQPLTVNFNAMTGGNLVEGFIAPDDDLPSYIYEPGFGETSLVIAGGSLAPNTDYDFALDFINITHVTTGDVTGFAGADGVSGWVSSMKMPFHTNGVVEFDVANLRIHEQSVNNEQPAAPQQLATEGYIEAVYDTDIANANITGPGIVTSMNQEDDFPEWGFFVTRNDESEFTTNGVYDFSISGGDLGVKSQSIELTGSPLEFPNTPYLTFDAFNDLQNFDTTMSYTVNFNDMFGGQSIEVNMDPVTGGNIFELDLDAFATSFEIPAGTLSPDTEYDFALEFINVANEIEGNDSLGFDGSPGIAEWISLTTLNFTTASNLSGIVEFSLGNGRIAEQLVGGVAPTVVTYESGVNVGAESNLDGVTVLLEGLTSGPVVIDKAMYDPEWDGTVQHADLASMLAEAPGGTYTLTVQGGNLDGVSQTIDLVGDASDLPNTPFVSATTFDDLQNGMNYTQPLAIEFNAMTGGTFIDVYIDGEPGSESFSDDFLAPETTSLVVPSGALSPNTTYTLDVIFVNANNETVGDVGGFEGAEGLSGWFSQTGMSFHTNGVVEFEVANVRYAEQTANNAEPGSVAFYETNGYLETVYNSDAATVTVVGPGINEVMAKDPEAPAWNFFIERMDENDFGTDDSYTFSIEGGDLGAKSQAIEVTGDSSYFPNLPYLTLDSFNDLQGMDTTQAMTVHFNEMFFGTVIEAFMGPMGDGNDFDLELDANETSFVIPADALTAGMAYDFELSFLNDTNYIDGLEEPGFDGAPGIGVWESITIIHFTTGGGVNLLGDVDGNGIVDAFDIETMSLGLLAGTDDLNYDVNGDGDVDSADGVFLVTDILGYFTADFDFNGQVDVADLSTWATGFGNEAALFAQGDADFNGQVDVADLSTWATQFGSTTPAPLSLSLLGGINSGAVAIPEPSGLALLGAGALCLSRRRRRRGRGA